MEVSDEAIEVGGVGIQGDGIALGHEPGAVVEEELEAVGGCDEEAVMSIGVDIEEGEGGLAGEVLGQGGGGDIGERDGDTLCGGLFDDEGGAGIGMDAAFEAGDVHGFLAGLEALGLEGAVFFEGILRGFRLVITDEALAESVPGCGVVGFEAEEFLVGGGGVFEVAEFLVGGGELEGGCADFGGEVFGLLEHFEGFLELAHAFEGASGDVVGGGEVAVEGDGALGVVEGVGGVFGEEEGVGEVQLRIDVGGVELGGLGEGVDGAFGFAAVVVILADVHPVGEVLGGFGR